MAWEDVEKRFGRELQDIRSIVSNYSYSKNQAPETDKILRQVFLKRMGKLRGKLSGLLENLYEDKKDYSKDFRSVRDLIDMAINDLGLPEQNKFPGDKNKLENIIIKDMELISLMANLENSVSLLEPINSGAPIKGLQDIKTRLKAFREALKDREDIIKSYGR